MTPDRSLNSEPKSNLPFGRQPIQLAIALLWLGFSLYAFFLAPPSQPDTLELITRLSTQDLAGINPLIVYLFNIMGVIPLLYSAVLYADGRGQKIPAWPFAVGSFFLGAFALLPYFVLREPNPQFVGVKNRLIRFWDARIIGILIAIAAVTLLVLGLSQGNWADFVAQWRSDRFIHVMSLDFCVLSLVFPVLLQDDLGRRGMADKYFWPIALVPLLGPLVYLMLRSRIVELPDGEVS
ncbi:MAG: hypothetical protein RLZZ511_824 [Cyanobacteriota bacterium]|jgi:hypothetical protein